MDKLFLPVLQLSGFLFVSLLLQDALSLYAILFSPRSCIPKPISIYSSTYSLRAGLAFLLITCNSAESFGLKN